MYITSTIAPVADDAGWMKPFRRGVADRLGAVSRCARALSRRSKIFVKHRNQLYHTVIRRYASFGGLASLAGRAQRLADRTRGVQMFDEALVVGIALDKANPLAARGEAVDR
ncbi:hypothetical protein A4G29_02875 [Mycobacterium kansasii]|nr:hypothetical protein A4G29_02875 [Mycobacterium kansasii]